MDPTPVVWQPRVKFQDRVWLHVLLFALTIATTTFVGMLQYASFLDDFRGSAALPMPFPALLLRGFWYSGTILAILGCHELGHYFACRYYDVDASLPFFIPVPILMTGTMGAFIRIREPIPQKRMLFDIGIAGPIAGFLVAVPALLIGIAMSHVVRLPADQSNLLELGEPLLFKLASWLVWGTQPDGYTLNMHPMAFAAWFGLLATALNLFPIGQLDGGHISYAVLGSRRSTYVTFATVMVVMGLAGTQPLARANERAWRITLAVVLAIGAAMLLVRNGHPLREPGEAAAVDGGDRLIDALAALLGRSPFVVPMSFRSRRRLNTTIGVRRRNRR